MDELIKRMNALEKKQKEEKEELVQRICELEDQVGYLNEKIQKLEKEQEKLQKSEDSEESWLYYCERNKTIKQILEKVDLSLDNEVSEFDYNQWQNESVMWQQIISRLQNQQVAYKQMSIQQLRQVGKETIKKLVNKEILIIIRNIPNQDEQQFHNQLPILIQLCETISNCWEESSDFLGRLVVVLESDTKLDELRIEKENQKIILQVEQIKF